MAPALRIPISANLTDFEKGMEQARSSTISTAKSIVTSFNVANKAMAAAGLEGTAGLANLATKVVQLVSPLKAAELAAKGTSLALTGIGTAGSAAFSAGLLGAATRFGASMLPWLATKGAVIAAFGAIAGAIYEARKNIEEMVEISEKAGKTGISAETLQGFLLVTRTLKVEAKDLESALIHAFSATKEKLDVTLPLFERLREFFQAGFVGEGAKGFDLFRNAQNQDQKIRAILVAMVELEKEGQKLAALDIGEKMFGAAFVDKIRQGKTSAQELLETLDNAKAGGVAGGDIFSDELVKRAADVDKELKKANETLERNLRPAWDGLVDAALTIKSVWASIVGLIAEAAKVSEVFGREAKLRQDIGERDQLRARLADENLQYAAREQILRRLAALSRTLAPLDAKTFGTEFSGEPTVGGYGPPPIPTPRENPLKGTFGHQRRFDEKVKAESAEASNRLDTEITRLERHISVQEADAKAVGLTAGEKERLRVQSVLLNAAEQAGIDLLDIANPKTLEYISTIEKLADKSANAAEKQKQAQESLAAFKSIGADLSSGFQSAVFEAKKFDQVIKDILRSLASRQLNKLFENLATSAFNNFGGPRAEGGPVVGGTAYLVGEKRPELFIPNMSGTIAPNPVLAGGGGGGSRMNVIINNNAGADVSAGSPTPDGAGGFNLQVFVDKIKGDVAGDIADKRGAIGSALRGAHGLRPVMRRR